MTNWLMACLTEKYLNEKDGQNFHMNTKCDRSFLSASSNN